MSSGLPAAACSGGGDLRCGTCARARLASHGCPAGWLRFREHLPAVFPICLPPYQAALALYRGAGFTQLGDELPAEPDGLGELMKGLWCTRDVAKQSRMRCTGLAMLHACCPASKRRCFQPPAHQSFPSFSAPSSAQQSGCCCTGSFPAGRDVGSAPACQLKQHVNLL